MFAIIGEAMQAHTLATSVELATFARHKNPASTAHYMCLDSCSLIPWCLCDNETLY